MRKMRNPFSSKPRIALPPSQSLTEIVKAFADTYLTIEREKLEILKRQLGIQSSEVPNRPEVPLPADIAMYTKQESETWAREDVEKIARQLYDEYGNWDS